MCGSGCALPSKSFLITRGYAQTQMSPLAAGLSHCLTSDGSRDTIAACYTLSETQIFSTHPHFADANAVCYFVWLSADEFFTCSRRKPEEFNDQYAYA